MTHRADCRLVYGNIFDLNDARRMMGLICSAPQSAPPLNEPRKVVLVGHNFRKDFDKTASELLFDLKHNEANVMGVLDTEWLATDLEYPHEFLASRPSLANIVNQYKLAKMEWSEPRKKDRKWDFEGAHNAGNDAIMNLKAILAMAHDKSIETEEYNGCESFPAAMEDVSRNEPNKCVFRGNVILVAVDIEEQEYHPRNVTEFGIAWLDLATVQNLPYGERGDAKGLRGGHIWHSHIEARHFRVAELHWWNNKNFTVGNKLGFWTQFNRMGKSEMVNKADVHKRLYTQFRDFARKRIVPLPPLPVVEKPAEKKTTAPVEKAKPTEKAITDNSSGSHGRTDSSTTNTTANNSLSKEPVPALKISCKPHVGRGAQGIVDREAKNLQNAAVGSSYWDQEYIQRNKNAQEHFLRALLAAAKWNQSQVEAALKECDRQNIRLLEMSNWKP